MRQGWYLRSRTLGIVLTAIATAWSVWLLLHGEGEPNGEREPTGGNVPPVDACLQHTSDMTTEPGEVVTLDASVVLGTCKTAATVAELDRAAQKEAELRVALHQARQQDDEIKIGQASEALTDFERTKGQHLEQVTREAVVGGKARLRLAAPLFPGRVGSISEVDQVIDSDKDRATWAWELSPDKPGDYNVSLVLSILDASNQELLVQNEREEVTIHVKGTFGYYAGRVWTNTTNFLTSLQGATASAAAIGISVASIWGFRQRKGKGKRRARSTGTQAQKKTGSKSRS
jgi:hypothetical protein